MDPIGAFPYGLILLALGTALSLLLLAVPPPLGRLMRALAFAISLFGLLLSGYAVVSSIIFRMNLAG